MRNLFVLEKQWGKTGTAGELRCYLWGRETARCVLRAVQGAGNQGRFREPGWRRGQWRWPWRLLREANTPF